MFSQLEDQLIMADGMSEDIKELQETLFAFLEKSLAAFAQKQDFQFQQLIRTLAKKQDSQFQELKKLILLDSRTSPQSTTNSDLSAKLSSSEVDSDLKTAEEIPSFDGSTEDEGHGAPKFSFIREEDTGSKLPPSPPPTWKYNVFVSFGGKDTRKGFVSNLFQAFKEEETESKLPPSSPPPTWKYDVFVSFRGKDTRKGFVSHLFQAFKREDINCYRDVDGNERGQEVDSMLIDAIRHSKMAIVLLSQNYADSKWCLQELVEILSWNKQHHIHGHEVLPIFYDVSSSDVRHLGGTIGKAFGRCIAKNGQDNKDIWQDALKQVGRISSWSSNNGDEAYLIQEIVQVLLEKVAYSRSPLLLKSSIIPNDNLSHLCSMLEMTSNKVVRTVGICGPEGVGKTTLAIATCVNLRNVFEGRVILLEDIHAVETTEDLLQIQSKIAVKLLKDKWLQLSEDTNKNILEIRARLPKKKVLIVLDNVTTSEQVERVLGKAYEKYLGLGSRVVISSRDWVVLDNLKVDDIYMVPPLNHQNSLKLFYHYAFMGRQEVDVIKEYEELSKNIVHYAAGLPPVLESFGYSLSNAPETEWYTKLSELDRSRNCGDTKVYQCGPFGGRGRVESRWDDGEHCDVRGIELVIVDSVIKSIGITYDNYGNPVGPLFHGSSSSSSNVLPKKIELFYPSEYLMAISGYLRKTEATEATICSLTLHSNKRTFGPFGDQSKTGQPFSTDPTGAKIVGFFGAGDSQLQCVGVHAKQVSHTYPHNQVLGPFGKYSGDSWDHGAFTGIRKIIISLHKSDSIASIRCVYDNNGAPIEKLSHEEQQKKKKNKERLSQESQSSHFKQVEVTLNYPAEFIISMSGSHRNAFGSYHFSSLTFQTNLTTYGPYGYEKEILTFSTPLGLGKIVGFYGSSHCKSLTSIGAYLAPVYYANPLAIIIKPSRDDVFSKTWADA